jgi:type II secretory pathway pseudopilin PulG
MFNARRRAGFANPEPMIALAAIGILIAIIVPQIALMREKRRTLAGLYALRGAVAAYADQTKTKSPRALSDLTTDGRYLAALPKAGVSGRHSPSSAVLQAAAADDAGGWVYSNPPGAEPAAVFINCTHTDRGGRSWSSY